MADRVGKERGDVGLENEAGGADVCGLRITRVPHVKKGLLDRNGLECLSGGGKIGAFRRLPVQP